MVICKDIEGNEITKIKLGDDGIVYGVNDSLTVSYTIDADCCASFGYTFDSDNAICYWSDVSEVNSINVFVNPENEDGGYYLVPENSECELKIEFDYLIYFGCEKILKCKLKHEDLLNLKVNYILEMIDGAEKTVISTESLLGDSDLGSFLENNSNSGLFIADDFKQCIIFKNKLLSIFLDNGQNVSLESISSSWVKFNRIYDSPEFIDLIKGKKVRFGFNIQNIPCGFAIKVDNAKILNKCLTHTISKTNITKNPSFQMERVIDNKKVWLETDDERVHDLKYRETNYVANDDKLVLNSKELDLQFSSDNGIEHDLWSFIKNNPTILTNNLIDGVDLSLLLNFDYQNINNLNEFMIMLNSRLIDVKSNKTINDYPVLKLIYYRYVNSYLYTGVVSNAFTYNDMINFISILDNYWLELVEQFIPSTTIWGSTMKISNSIFDSQKFVYKKSSLIVIQNGADLDDYITTEDNVGVIATDLVTNQSIKYLNGLGIKQINDGSEFIGEIRILSPEKNNIFGDTITLSESKDSIRQSI